MKAENDMEVLYNVHPCPGVAPTSVLGPDASNRVFQLGQYRDLPNWACVACAARALERVEPLLPSGPNQRGSPVAMS